ncbi:putative ArsR family transcriptional regulator [Rathayibacter sp. PhB152]|uniref:ArsR family transcriptional regulator n=1 Tax=Rathayibacter festucae DSM 15932 TaxID=1328866 RepID=A0A3Q9UTB4_9MICO|nr:winged helix-turn-helix domain-containing protein [Rathayibacter sp. PhB152]AZZ52688.1 ArsR family transcriptional regulator [Rathayibacter festucae DSM 15932]ROQ56050.1 putative ArsR family transcriptional regulator [Rathayibacter sp. PhB152]
MKSTVPTIAPLLRSDLQGNLLAALMLRPGESSLSALAERIEASPSSVQREIERLVASGFVLERRSGRNRYVRANEAHPLAAPVRIIVEYAYGPRVVLSRVLSGIPLIEEAYIHGSWAARMAGEEGADPADVDVLVIGGPDRADLLDAATAAQSELGREVDIRSVSRRRWDEASDPFLQTLKTRPLVRLDVGNGVAE